MKAILFAATLILLSSPATAAVYKCTAANGQITFSDKPCADERQEVVQVRSGGSTAAPIFVAGEDATFEIDRAEQLAGGQPVSSSSPLASAYMNFYSSLSRCDRDEIAGQMPAAAAADFLEVSDIELKQGCGLLSVLMPSDFEGATEVINGDSGTIQWLRVETTTDADGTSTMTSEMTAEFVRENGEWKFAGN